MVTVLVIDNNLLIRENTAEFLAMEGYHVITVIDGEEGYDKIVEHRPEIIVCDFLLPKIDGFELLGKMGHYLELKNIPLIFFSSKGEKSDIQKGFDSGASDYIVKPSNLNNLFVSIRRCLKTKNIS